MNRRRTFIGLLAVPAAVALAKGCGDGDGPVTPPDPPRPATVAVSPAAAELSALGATVQLSAEVRDQHGQALAGAAVVWGSDNTPVATVDGSGLVTAVGDGTATITARAGEASGTAAVTVKQEAASVMVTPAEATLPVGDTVRLAAEVRDANGALVEDAAVVWSSGAEAVAAVDPAGLVRAVAAGETVVTATSGGASGGARVTVVEPSDRGALVSLYRSTGGAKWLDGTNWLTDAPLGAWYGVTVDRTGRVVRLELDANNLAGPIPRQIEHLTQLRHLTLADNSLDGRIPPELRGHL